MANIICIFETVDWARSFKRTLKLFEKGGYQGSWKIQIRMISVTPTKKSIYKGKAYISGGLESLYISVVSVTDILKGIMDWKHCR